MAAYWVWWILAGGLVAAELLTGTFYLLAVGVAFAVGGVAAWLGASAGVQLAVAAVLAIGGTFVAHRWRNKHAAPAAEVPFDVGQAVVALQCPDQRTAVARGRGQIVLRHAGALAQALQELAEGRHCRWGTGRDGRQGVGRLWETRPARFSKSLGSAGRPAPTS